MSLKNPMTSPGIDLGTVRLVAQRLNHYAIRTPLKRYCLCFITIQYITPLISRYGQRASERVTVIKDCVQRKLLSNLVLFSSFKHSQCVK